eukprot:TCONS_00047034-protein
MVNWRDEFESKRRFEAARRLIYSHPSVAGRCRTLQRQLGGKKARSNEARAQETNLPSINKTNIDEMAVTPPLICKSYSAPSLMRGLHKTQKPDLEMLDLIALGNFGHERTQSSSAVRKFVVSPSMLTARNIFPSIDNVPKPPKIDNFLSSRDQNSTNNENASTIFEGWGQRKRHILKEKYRPSPPQDVELHIKAIDPVLKHMTLLSLNKDNEITSPPLNEQGQVWKQNESVVSKHVQKTHPIEEDKTKKPLGALKVKFPVPNS